MLKLSELMIANPDMTGFDELLAAVREGARRERFFRRVAGAVHHPVGRLHRFLHFRSQLTSAHPFHVEPRNAGRGAALRVAWENARGSGITAEDSAFDEAQLEELRKLGYVR